MTLTTPFVHQHFSIAFKKKCNSYEVILGFASCFFDLLVLINKLIGVISLSIHSALLTVQWFALYL